MTKINFVKTLLISDFNIDIFSRYLNNDAGSPSIRSEIAPHGQVIPSLLSDISKQKFDTAIVWTQPGGVVGSFNSFIELNPGSIKKTLDQVDGFAEALIKFKQGVNTLFVPSWVIPAYYRYYGPADMQFNKGISNVLLQMNLRLTEKLDNIPGIYVMNSGRWIEASGRSAFDPKMWYLTKVPYGNNVFKEAVTDIKAALTGISGLSKKLIIVDLDDTLWGGILGEVGFENLVLGGHDHLGEAFIDFQKALKILKNKGILLAIASKNDEQAALKTIEDHPEMILNLNDFASFRINWNDKAKNISDIVSELNIGMDSVVFIDDNPVERDRVKTALPEVLVPEWPKDKMLYAKTLMELRCFDTPSLSDEDINRSNMYITERKRKKIKSSMGSIESWLKGLKTSIEIEQLNDVNLQRTVQLLNKTNQMNLTTRRLSETEFMEWSSQKNNKIWTFRVSDKFGDSGLTGIMSLEVTGKTAFIKDFVLSCRVIGRKVEEAVLYTAMKYCKESGINVLKAQYISTERNSPCLDFFINCNAEHDKNENIFTWKVTKDAKPPKYIEIIEKL